MDRIEQLESENRRLRTNYEILEQQHEELEHELEAAGERIAELENELEHENDGFTNGSDEECVYLASRRRPHFHRLSCKYAPYLVNSPNLIEYGSHREAVEAGKKPCKTCRA
jgi:hypothetical protein